jgi:hypothetical protein
MDSVYTRGLLSQDCIWMAYMHAKQQAGSPAGGHTHLAGVQHFGEGVTLSCGVCLTHQQFIHRLHLQRQQTGSRSGAFTDTHSRQVLAPGRPGSMAPVGRAAAELLLPRQPQPRGTLPCLQGLHVCDFRPLLPPQPCHRTHAPATQADAAVPQALHAHGVLVEHCTHKRIAQQPSD